VKVARTVYSSGPGGARSAREKRSRPEGAEPGVDRSPAEHAVRVRLERSGRRGKRVTVAGPLFLRRETARELLRRLRNRCGTGGTLKLVRAAAGDPAFELELQGDQVERALEILAELGFAAKRSGG
jgi:translation initiation factor 1